MQGATVEGGFQHLPAHIVEDHVEALRRECAKSLDNILATLVETGVEPSLSTTQQHFCGPRGAGDAGAEATGDLAGERAVAAGGDRNEVGAALGRLSHVRHAEVGGEATHAEDGEYGLGLHAVRAPGLSVARASASVLLADNEALRLATGRRMPCLAVLYIRRAQRHCNDIAFRSPAGRSSTA